MRETGREGNGSFTENLFHRLPPTAVSMPRLRRSQRNNMQVKIPEVEPKKELGEDQEEQEDEAEVNMQMQEQERDNSGNSEENSNSVSENDAIDAAAFPANGDESKNSSTPVENGNSDEGIRAAESVGKGGETPASKKRLRKVDRGEKINSPAESFSSRGESLDVRSASTMEEGSSRKKAKTDALPEIPKLSPAPSANTEGRVDVREVLADVTEFDESANTLNRIFGSESDRLRKLRMKYEDLRDMRITKPEKLLEEARKAHENDRALATDTIAAYKARTKNLQLQLKNKSGGRSFVTMEDDIEARIQKIRDDAQADAKAALARSNQKHERELSKLKRELKQTIAERDQAKVTVRTLRKENAAKTAKNSHTVDASASDAEIERLRCTVKYYEMLTGMHLKLREVDMGLRGGVICMAKTNENHKSVEFELDLVESEDGSGHEEWEYTPGANIEILPEHLQEEIEFPKNMAPVFVTQLVSSLFSSSA